MHLRCISGLVVNSDVSVFAGCARKTEEPDGSHIRGVRTVEACTSSAILRLVVNPNVPVSRMFLGGVIALGISYRDVWKHNAIHYFAHPIGRAVEKRRRCISSWGVSEYRSEKNPSPMLECAKIDVNRGRSKYMSKKKPPPRLEWAKYRCKKAGY